MDLSRGRSKEGGSSAGPISGVEACRPRTLDRSTPPKNESSLSTRLLVVPPPPTADGAANELRTRRLNGLKGRPRSPTFLFPHLLPSLCPVSLPFSPSSLLCASPWLVATSTVPLRPRLRVRGCRLLSPPSPLPLSSRQAPRLPPPTSRGRRLSSPSFTSQCRLSLLFFAYATVSLTVNLVVGAVTWTLLSPPRPRDDTFALRPVDRPLLRSAGRTQEMPSSSPRWNNSRRRPFCPSTVTRTRRRSSDRCVGSDLLNCPSLSCPH